MKIPPTHIVVPVKTTERAKGRLSQILAPAARRDLARAMLRDVLRAATRVRSVTEVWVVSHDGAILKEVEGWGARPLKEKYDMGLNPALRFATKEACAQGAEALLVLPSDVPLITPDDLERVLRPRGRASADQGLVVGVPSTEGTGTNALLRIPPDVIPPRFGPASFDRHTREAARRKVRFITRRVARLARDVDTPKDLIALLSRERRGETARVLERLGLL